MYNIRNIIQFLLQQISAVVVSVFNIQQYLNHTILHVII
jgi:hypothetical protein